jgi:chromosome segregation ATPase
MLKRTMGRLLLPVVFLMAGCATTGRNYQTDIDALNARVSALQGELAAKDQEINDQRLARESAELAMRAAEDERRQLSSKLESAKAESRKAGVPASDLK